MALISCSVYLIVILTRLAFFVYWFFDNLAILSKLKLLKFNLFTVTVSAMLSWFTALLLSILLNLKKLIALKNERVKIRSILKNFPEKKPDWQNNIEKNKIATKAATLTIVKCLGDMIPSGVGSGLTLLVGNKFNDTHAGIGGLVSSVISCYEITQRIK